MYRSMSDVPEHEHHDRRDQELERLRRMVRDSELEVQGRRRRRNHDEHAEGSVSVRGSHRELFHQSGSRRSRDYADKDSISLEGQRPESALGSHATKQFLEASTNSNVLEPISNETYSLLGIINFGPTHMSGTKG